MLLSMNFLEFFPPLGEEPILHILLDDNGETQSVNAPLSLCFSICDTSVTTKHSIQSLLSTYFPHLASPSLYYQSSSWGTGQIPHRLPFCGSFSLSSFLHVRYQGPAFKLNFDFSPKSFFHTLFRKCFLLIFPSSTFHTPSCSFWVSCYYSIFQWDFDVSLPPLQPGTWSSLLGGCLYTSGGPYGLF